MSPGEVPAPLKRRMGAMSTTLVRQAVSANKIKAAHRVIEIRRAVVALMGSDLSRRLSLRLYRHMISKRQEIRWTLEASVENERRPVRSQKPLPY